MKCVYCDNELDEEEAEDPHRDRDGDPLCDECHREHFQFTCCGCGNYGDNEDQHNMLVVFDAEGAFDEEDRKARFGRGVYRVKDRPYYVSDYFSMQLRTRCLERIGDVPKGADPEGFACGHLCLECQQEVDRLEAGSPPSGRGAPTPAGCVRPDPE